MYGNNYGNLWHFYKKPVCPDPVWKPVSSEEGERDWGERRESRSWGAAMRMFPL